MTEKQEKTEKATKKQFELIMDEFKNLNLRVDKLETAKAALESASSTVTPSPPQSDSPLTPGLPLMKADTFPSESGLDHYHNCPTCHKLINAEAKTELQPEIEKEIIAAYKQKVKNIKNPVLCEGCGEIVEREEPKCTSCGSTKARKF